MLYINIIIIGAANPTIIRLIEDINASSNQRFRILGFVDNNWEKIGKTAWGFKVFPGFNSLDELDRTRIKLINTIASSMKVRRETTDYFVHRNWSFANLVHPRTNIGYVSMGTGNIFYETAMIQPYVEIGSHCIFSACSGVAHETKLGSFCFIGPASYICGHVKLGNNVYVGTGANILPRLHIGDNAIIGAGALVNTDVLSNTKVKGLPAKVYE